MVTVHVRTRSKCFIAHRQIHKLVKGEHNQKLYIKICSVDHLLKVGGPTTNKNTKFNVHLAMEENPHYGVRQVGQDIMPFLVQFMVYLNWKSGIHLRYLFCKICKSYLTMIQIEELNFCQILMDICNDNPHQVEHILLSHFSQ